MVNKRTPKRQVRRTVNKDGYINKRTGKKVGPYKRKMNTYPSHYFTELIDPRTGQKRWAEVWVKGKDRRYKWVNDKRRAELILKSKAEQHFKSLPQKRQESDLRKTSKNQLEIIEKEGKEYVKSSYLTESGPSRYDIQGIDTKIDDWVKDWKKAKKIQKKYEKARGFYADFHDFEERENKRNDLEGRIKFLEIDLKVTPHKEKVRKEIEQCKKELKQLGDVKWQKKPQNYYYFEVDPRYKKLEESKRLTYAGAKQELYLLESEEKNTNNFARKGRLQYLINEKKREVRELEKESIELRDNPKYIFWNDNLIEATLKAKKVIPSNVITQMPEEYKLQYNKIQETKLGEKRKRDEELKREHAEIKRKAIEREKAIEQAKTQLPEMQEKFSQNAKGKYSKEMWKEQALSDLGEGLTGITDPSRITLLTTNEQLKRATWGEQFEDHKEVSFKKEMIMDLYGFQYEFDDKEECSYNQEYIDLAIKSMDNPKMYYKKDTPLVIKDDTYTYLIAPRVTEIDDFDEDDKPPKKDAYDPTIRISQNKYRELMKSTTKAEMIKQCETLKPGYDSKKKDKHEILHDLLKKKKKRDWESKHEIVYLNKPALPKNASTEDVNQFALNLINEEDKKITLLNREIERIENEKYSLQLKGIDKNDNRVKVLNTKMSKTFKEKEVLHKKYEIKKRNLRKN